MVGWIQLLLSFQREIENPYKYIVAGNRGKGDGSTHAPIGASTSFVCLEYTVHLY